MKINKKLDQWRAAGIIDETTAEKISLFEKESTRSYGIIFLTGFGAISIALGIVAIVASNWQVIPASIKILLLFFLCLLVSFFIFKQKFKLSSSSWTLDSLMLVYSGLVISGIGLIDQVFQLRGPISNLLLVWALAIGPLVFFSSGILAPLHWVLLVLTVFTVWIFKWSNVLTFYPIFAACILLPLFFIFLGLFLSLKKKLPNFSKIFSSLGWVFLIIVGSIGQVTWHSTPEPFRTAAQPALLLTCIGVSFFFGLLKVLSIRLNFFQSALILYCTLSPFLSLVLSFNSALFGALGFMLIWALVAANAFQYQNSLLFKQATFIVFLRLFILYSQTLGGFLGTGFGLILSGILFIVGVKIWYSKSDAFIKKWRS